MLRPFLAQFQSDRGRDRLQTSHCAPKRTSEILAFRHGEHQRKGRGCWVEGAVAGTDDACAAGDSAAGGGGLRRGKGTDPD
jgi:hypothetical protein